MKNQKSIPSSDFNLFDVIFYVFYVVYVFITRLKLTNFNGSRDSNFNFDCKKKKKLFLF